MPILMRFSHGLILVSAAALVVIVAVTLADVVMGAVTGRPLGGIYEIVETALAFCVFLSIPEVFRTESHIRVDLIEQAVPRAVMRPIDVAARALTVVFAMLLVGAMLAPARDSWRFGDVKYESGIPVWFIWSPILFGAAVAAICALAVFRRPQAGVRPME